MLVEKIKQLNSDSELLSITQNIRLGMPTAVFGVTSTAKAVITSLIDQPVLYIAKDVLALERIATLIEQVSGKSTATLYPKDDVILYKRAFSKYSLFKRLNGLYQIKKGAQVVVTTLPALSQLFPTKFPIITVEKGKEIVIADIVKELVEMGYVRLDYVSGQGTFSVRGDILDVYAVNSENPYRIDFFGDEVETIKLFNQETREKISLLDRVDICPATDCFLDIQDKENIKESLSYALKSVKDANAYAVASGLLAEVEERAFNGDNNVLSFIMPLLSTVTTDIFHFLPKDTIVVYDEPKAIKDLAESVYKEHQERLKGLFNSGNAFEFSSAQLSDMEDTLALLQEKRAVALQMFTTAIPFFNPLKTYTLKVNPPTKYQLRFEDFYNDAKNWGISGYNIVVYTGNASKSNDLANALAERGCHVQVDGEIDFNGVDIRSDFLDEGVIFHSAKLAVIGNADLYNKKSNSGKIVRKSKEFFSAPEVGDYAVHETHGIGKVIGVKKITTTEGTKDYLALQYADSDVLYVSVEQMQTLTRYLGSDKEPKLSKIGGVEFGRVKERVKASIKALSFDLKKLYNERAERKGYVFEYDEGAESMFADSFPYDETPDQLSASEDIFNDMTTDKVMDRLLLGDVGYGKTEVALRAVFRCVINGKQAALLAPTTILSEQHYNTAVKRLSEFGVKVEVLNRFKTAQEQKDIVERLAQGKIDFIIGTHRLLGKDIAFKDLGLLVLDEEQRFGVEHKEKLKLIKNNVDTLTMTATPIPRTLHMSLSGIRDISTINTPPKERIPVSTYVTEETESLIRDAIMREIARGGQVFILYNRVDTIDRYALKLKSIVPEAEFCVAHGQMDERVLEDKITAFYRGDSDVLVSTTIIENGIDLPRANTLIVIDADKLGLSTLYQLKGRVGRSNRLAYAYFTFKEQKVLSEEAYKRLNTLMEFTEMGSGFKIAMRDLEIRGAGNVMGKEQHGHMDKIGYELYARLLKEEMEGVAQINSIELDIRVNAYIPEEYILSPTGRMETYKAIAEMSNGKEYNDIKNSLMDMYGEIPLEVANLFRISIIKNIGAKIGVKRIVISNDRCALEFTNLNDFNNESLMQAIELNKKICKVNLSTVYEINFEKSGRKNVEMLKIVSIFLQSVLPFGKNR